jgi:uncharacterized repeat protein (TIGR03803 family)
VLHNFGVGSDGGGPRADLIRDAAGNLYGTTEGGGAGYGTVFKIDSSNNETVLYSFTGGSDGAGPFAGLIRDAAGNLYGTTNLGGSGASGTVFMLNPTTQVLTTLYNFTGGSDGGRPIGGLITDVAGNLYGTTSQGGDYGFGTVFKIDTSYNETALYSFTDGNDGKYPYGSLTIDAQGGLYGTATAGGSNNCSSGCGTVFEFKHDDDSSYALLNGNNSFKGNQTVAGNEAATKFLGDGSNLTNLNAANLVGTASINTTGNAATATLASNATNADNLGGIVAASYARVDIGNTFNALQNFSAGIRILGGSTFLSPSTTDFASLNVPNTGAAPNAPNLGDLWLTSADIHLQFRDNNGVTQGLAFLSDVNSQDGQFLGQAKAYTDQQVGSEATRAQGVESALNLAIAAESTRAQGAEGTLSTSISNETTRAQAAEAAKASLDGGNAFTGGKQTVAASTNAHASLNVPNTGATPSTPVMGDVWLTAADIHLQFRDMNGVTQGVAFLSDVTSQDSNFLNQAKSYTDTQVGAEKARAQGAEGSLSTAISNETGRASSAETSLGNAISAETTRAQTAEAGKAKLSGGNGFTGDQTITGNESVSGNLGVAGTMTLGGGGTAITKHLSAVFNPGFPGLKSLSCATLTFTLVGVSDGDTTALGVANARMAGGSLIYTAWVSAADTITIQACNVGQTQQKNPGTGNIRVDVWKH